jgi:hypothetical protein
MRLTGTVPRVGASALGHAGYRVREMFRPVGSQPPSVYWRRRLVFAASVIVLIVLIALTIKVLTSSDPGKSGAAAPASTATSRSAASVPATSSASTPASTSGSRSPSTSSTAKSTASTGASSSAAPKACTPAALKLATATDKTSYTMADKPTLSLLVTNKSAAPCVQNLGDTQIVMRVYNGESRVWGSHDCKIDQTPNERTLAAGSTVRLNITWTEFASMPNQCQNRQRVGAGTYTLYASLSGAEATASQFSITPQ